MNAKAVKEQVDARAENLRTELRDEFAARAMQGWVTAAACNQAAEDMFRKAGIEPGQVEAFIARVSYSMAEAMMAERAQRKD